MHHSSLWMLFSFLEIRPWLVYVFISPQFGKDNDAYLRLLNFFPLPAWLPYFWILLYALCRYSGLSRACFYVWYWYWVATSSWPVHYKFDDGWYPLFRLWRWMPFSFINSLLYIALSLRNCQLSNCMAILRYIFTRTSWPVKTKNGKMCFRKFVLGLI